MQTEQTEHELIIRESPGCLWIFGLFFVLVGGIFAYGAIGGFTDYGSQPIWLLALAFVMGALAVSTGLWIIYGAPITRVVINRIANEVLMTRYGLFGKREDFYTFDDIEQFCLIEEKDDESNPVWSLGMNLSNGETVKISCHPSHDELFKREFVFQTNEFTRKQIPSTRMILESEDETDAEIS